MVVISITVTDQQGRPRRQGPPFLGAHRRAVLAVAAAVVLAAAGAIIGSTVGGRRTTRPPGLRPGQHVYHGAIRAIAGALGYPYPERCLTIRIASSDPDYASAEVGRTDGCGRYRGYTNASLHRVDGKWRLVLDEGQLFVPNRLLGPAST
jgi:hypothetical protein